MLNRTLLLEAKSGLLWGKGERALWAATEEALDGASQAGGGRPLAVACINGQPEVAQYTAIPGVEIGEGLE